MNRLQTILRVVDSLGVDDRRPLDSSLYSLLRACRYDARLAELVNCMLDHPDGPFPDHAMAGELADRVHALEISSFQLGVAVIPVLQCATRVLSAEQSHHA